MKVLCTFAGHYGDILWSLPTARELAKRCGGKVDFAVMPQFESLVPLLSHQSFIDKAFALENWKLEHECYGCQPWQSPQFDGRDQYEKVYDLTYRSHPHSMRLAEWTARQAEVSLPPVWVPFIEVERVSLKMDMVVSYNFNPMYPETKLPFLDGLKAALPRMTFVETGHMPWLAAATLIDDAICFVGCRSSNYALAHGVGAKVIIIEPHPMRGAPVFDFPFGPVPEVDVTRMRPDNQIPFAVEKILQWAKDKEDGEHYAAEAGRPVRQARNRKNQDNVLQGEESDQAADAVRERGTTDSGLPE